MNTINISVIENLGKDISSRHISMLLRNRCEEHVAETQGLVVFDFAGVRTLSESAADELFGVLAVSHGDAWYRKHLRLDNIKPAHQAVIDLTIGERAKRGVRNRPTSRCDLVVNCG